jgi:hypothetical protein
VSRFLLLLGLGLDLRYADKDEPDGAEENVHGTRNRVAGETLAAKAVNDFW